ncbi:unnamed protein product [Notodromas monacha]|uniref:Uncharacterized protein n=1 Tax=Notodromas monacha TaxID=399045 RepID=A0A7R9C2M8_9CRUS|nr:unnamed protein product [Notodromas monacha]CAG0925016.1 unnamed protein product [Notodromas monacha]
MERHLFQALGAAPNFFVGDSALQQTFMVGLATCMTSFLPDSHTHCVNSLIAGSSSGVSPQANSGVFGFLGGIVSSLNVFDFSWVKLAQAENCVLLANVGLGKK